LARAPFRGNSRIHRYLRNASSLMPAWLDTSASQKLAIL
jgi:hypothetical protein